MRIIIYTAIFGRYDYLKKPTRFANCSYMCFTDDCHLNQENWVVKLEKGHCDDARRNAKIFKILPHRYFPEFDYSLWVDGTHIPTLDVNILVERYLDGEDIAFFNHPDRTCIYQEAKACKKLRKDSEDVIDEQMDLKDIEV